MDQDRQIRLLIPAFFLYATLVSGIWAMGYSMIEIFHSENIFNILAAAAGFMALSSLPLGFLIGCISIYFLKHWFRRFHHKYYECFISLESFIQIREILNSQSYVLPGDILREQHNIEVAFSHCVLEKGIRDWLVRRWNSFNCSVHSLTAIILAYLIMIIMFISKGPKNPNIAGIIIWQIILLGIGLLLYDFAHSSFYDTFRMIEFQIERHFNSKPRITGRSFRHFSRFSSPRTSITRQAKLPLNRKVVRDHRGRDQGDERKADRVEKREKHK